jgi:hypothetical protein
LRSGFHGHFDFPDEVGVANPLWFKSIKLHDQERIGEQTTNTFLAVESTKPGWFVNGINIGTAHRVCLVVRVCRQAAGESRCIPLDNVGVTNVCGFGM